MKLSEALRALEDGRVISKSFGGLKKCLKYVTANETKVVAQWWSDAPSIIDFDGHLVLNIEDIYEIA